MDNCSASAVECNEEVKPAQHWVEHLVQQSVPVTVIPWGRMKTEQHSNLQIRSIRKDD
jgi:hypothetical protein